MIIEGAANAQLFETYMDHIFGPNLQAGQIMIMDNLSIIKDKRCERLSRGKGANCSFFLHISRTFHPLKRLSPKSRPSSAGWAHELTRPCKRLWHKLFLLLLPLMPLDGFNTAAIRPSQRRSPRPAKGSTFVNAAVGHHCFPSHATFPFPFRVQVVNAIPSEQVWPFNVSTCPPI